jgi:hypothetical protein
MIRGQKITLFGIPYVEQVKVSTVAMIADGTTPRQSWTKGIPQNIDDLIENIPKDRR